MLGHNNQCFYVSTQLVHVFAVLSYQDSVICKLTYWSYCRIWHFDWLKILITGDACTSREARHVGAPNLILFVLHAVPSDLFLPRFLSSLDWFIYWTSVNNFSLNKHPFVKLKMSLLGIVLSGPNKKDNSTWLNLYKTYSVQNQLK